jgi:hypothetical protein
VSRHGALHGPAGAFALRRLHSAAYPSWVFAFGYLYPSFSGAIA